MSDDQLEDLKQFIDGRISQSESVTRDEIEKLRDEMHGGFAGVAEAIEHINKTLDDHEQQITTLKHKTA